MRTRTEPGGSSPEAVLGALRTFSLVPYWSLPSSHPSFHRVRNQANQGGFGGAFGIE
ncbi:hypothetical protein [Streptomyces sp. NPDC046759]|uniref:hypothetical protein n=1 Tax=Streptomyces sp. NPDC046759 TaxID=3155019 RepID=UPI0033D03E32